MFSDIETFSFPWPAVVLVSSKKGILNVGKELKSCKTTLCTMLPPFLVMGCLSIDSGDVTGNATFKMKSSCFKLCRVYSSSVKMSNEGEFPRGWFLGHRIQVRKRKKNRRPSVFTSSIKREIRHFHVVVVHWRQRNIQKRRAARAWLLFCLSNL